MRISACQIRVRMELLRPTGVQLNDDNQDDEELETVGKMTTNRAMSSKESERKKREIITIGKAKGFLTYDEVNDHMLESIGSSDQIDDWLSTLGGEGIEIVDSVSHVKGTDKLASGEVAPEEEAEPEPARTPEVEEEEEDGYSATNDPVRLYMRKMGSVSLLTRQGEVEIAKRIENGERRVLQVVLNSTVAVKEILDLCDKLRQQKIRVKEVVQDADEDDAEFDENWHVERVCKVMRHRGGPSAPPWQARSPPLVCAFQARLWVFAEHSRSSWRPMLRASRANPTLPPSVMRAPSTARNPGGRGGACLIPPIPPRQRKPAPTSPSAPDEIATAMTRSARGSTRPSSTRLPFVESKTCWTSAAKSALAGAATLATY